MSEKEPNLHFDNFESDDLYHEMSPDSTIRITREQYSLFELARHIRRGRVNIAPDFQRFRAWNESQCSELMESILMGIPIPMIYLFENELGLRQVVDGKQRLTAMYEFVENRFKLTGLKMLSQFNNFEFKSLPPILQAKIEDCQIQTYIIQPPTPEVVKFYIFERINRGGTRLNQQEMRYALHQGSSTELLIKIADSYILKFLDIGPLENKRMEKEYMALRYITFFLYANNYIQYNTSKIDNLDEMYSFIMGVLNNYNEADLSYVYDKTIKSLHLAYSTLGENAFKSSNDRHITIISLFEIITFVLSDYDVSNALNKNQEAVINVLNWYKSFIIENKDIYGEYKTTNGLFQRVSLARKIIEDIKVA
ncbi:TPA: DUF262 domain-containing protein [Photobacterium damselae]